ncbi:hypothetical protein Bbelb_284990 [Branchiostoma belcheri]|nr:hypothetical protein Bbelb_284990 [Branchiostoma belcheri]
MSMVIEVEKHLFYDLNIYLPVHKDSITLNITPTLTTFPNPPSIQPTLPFSATISLRAIRSGGLVTTAISLRTIRGGPLVTAVIKARASGLFSNNAEWGCLRGLSTNGAGWDCLQGTSKHL